MKKKVFLLGLTALTTVALASCGGDSSSSGFDKEKDPLVLSSQEVDRVFNPFFSSSAPDSNVVGMTQLGMLSSDENGNVAYGKDEATVVLDYEEVTTNAGTDDARTTYYFVLKNDVKFSNGSQLTIKDVLFNLYVYLDPVYTGSSTIYSTEIVGLQEYRTQQTSEKAQDSYMQEFYGIANTKITDLVEITELIFEENDGASMTMDEYRDELSNWEADSIYGTLVEDFDKTCELFKEELETDYANSQGTAGDIVFYDGDIAHEGLLTTDVEAFLYNEGYIEFDEDLGKVVCELDDLSEVKTWSKTEAIDMLYNIMIPMNVEEVVTYWATANELNTYLVNKAMSDKISDEGQAITRIEGIKFANKDEMVVVKGNEYAAPKYDANGNLTSGYEVLSIEIEGVDPKAIWNFSFGVAPLYYYSDQEFDYDNDKFGVKYADQDWMTNVVKNPDKIGLPVGAGAYKVSSASGNSDNVQSGDFYNKGVIYFERNEHFLLGAPEIKYVRYQVVASNAITNALYNNEVDFVQPNSKPETIADLNNHKGQGIENESIKTNGYGYIGVNAGKIPSVYVRQAIMHAIDTD